MTSHAENPSPMPAPHPDQLALDAQGHLGRDLPCRTCGYNLRGLSADATCPECGTAVTWSLQHDLLRYSDPAWVKGLGSGVGMILAAFVTLIAGYFLLIGVTIVLGAVQAPAAPSDTAGLFVAGLTLAAALVAMLLNLVGTWRLTAPDPGRKSEPEGVSVRGVARWSVIGGWSMYVLAAALMMASEFAGLLMLPAVLLLMAGFIAILMHLRRLALRVPDRSLGAQTTIVMWGFITMWGGWLLMVVALIAWMIVMFSTLGAGGTGGGAGAAGVGMIGGIALSVFGCVFLIASAVFGIWLLVLLAMYRTRLNRAADEAAATLPVAADPV